MSNSEISNSTDQLCKSLEKAAISKEREKYDRAFAELRVGIDLQGVTEGINVELDDGTIAIVNTTRLFDNIRDTLIKKRSDRLKAREVACFLEKVKNMQSHIHALESIANGEEHR